MIKPFRGDYILTQGFGENPQNYSQFGLKGHNGLDYGLPSNTQVIAPFDGKIIEASSDPTGYGLYIKIENTKEGSVMAHLATFQVKVGDNVSEGQPIALSDNTGNSTGPHLHWGYYLFPRDRTNGYAGFIDQLPLLEPDLQKQLDEMRNQRDDNWNKFQASETENLKIKLQLETANNKLKEINTLASKFYWFYRSTFQKIKDLSA